MLHSGTLIYAECHYGFPKDEKMARRYYSMVVRATIDECAAINKEAAATWLREHPASKQASKQQLDSALEHELGPTAYIVAEPEPLQNWVPSCYPVACKCARKSHRGFVTD